MPKGKDLLDRVLEIRRDFIKSKLTYMSIEDIEELNACLENLHNGIGEN